jgi:PAN domain
MVIGRRLATLAMAWVSALALLAAVLTSAAVPALAQAGFDRPGGDYSSAPVNSGDPADCALLCEHDRHCRAWSFNYPTVMDSVAVCWLKNSVPTRIPDNCCVSGVRGAGVVEIRNGAVETAIDRPGGDYRSFEIRSGESKEAKEGKEANKEAKESNNESEKGPPDAEDLCKAACNADNKCRAWTFARPGYVAKEAHCFLKKEIKPPRRRAGFTSGVLR